MTTPAQVIVFSLSVEDICVISEALADRPYKIVSQTIQRMQAQINQQQLVGEMTAPSETPLGAENGSSPISHSS